MTRLCSLHTYPAGRCGTIVRIDAEEDLAARMRALGLILGRRVQVVRRSPFQGPIQVRAGQTDVIIRRSEAARVFLTPCDPEHTCTQA